MTEQIQKVIYDLNKPNRNYEALYRLFSEIDPGYQRVQDSFVLLATPLDPVAIRGAIRLTLGDADDDVFVEPLTDEWSAALRPEVLGWLERHGRGFRLFQWDEIFAWTRERFALLRQRAS